MSQTEAVPGRFAQTYPFVMRKFDPRIPLSWSGAILSEIARNKPGDDEES